MVGLELPIGTPDDDDGCVLGEESVWETATG